MTSSSAEATIRRILPITRFLNGYLPLPLTRWLVKQGIALLRLPTGITREFVSADGVSCVWLIPENSPKEKVLLYLHGGGFVISMTSLHLQMVAYLALKMGIRVLLVDYRVAPEYPFPTPLDDCVSAYRWLLKQGFSAQNIVVAGDSAGGNLTITTLMALRDRNEALPAAAACLSPVGDMSNKDKLFTSAYDPLLHPRAGRVYHRSYVAENDERHPLISPIFGDWRGLPPLLVHAGDDELLRDDSVLIGELAKKAGVDIRLKIYPRMWHVWQLYLNLPEAIQSLDEIAQFLNAHLESKSESDAIKTSMS
jgi:epsilon-lactone hydrolase